MKRGFFICFVGIDGSGKSTLSQNLIKNLESEGVSTKYVWNRYTPILMKIPMVIANKVAFSKNEIYSNYNSYTKKKRKLFKSQLISLAYENFLMLDYVIQMIIKVKIPLFFGTNIVCDRFLFDTIASDLAVDLNYSESKITSFLNRYLLISPSPNLIFLVDAPEEIAFKRKNDTPSIDYLKERRKICLFLGDYYNMCYVDGTKAIDQLNKEILAKTNTIIKGEKNE